MAEQDQTSDINTELDALREASQQPVAKSKPTSLLEKPSIRAVDQENRAPVTETPVSYTSAPELGSGRFRGSDGRVYEVRAGGMVPVEPGTPQ